MKEKQQTTNSSASYLQAMKKVLDTLEEDVLCNLVVVDSKAEGSRAKDDFFDAFDNAFDDTDEDDLDDTTEWVIESKGQPQAFQFGYANTNRIQRAINNSIGSRVGVPAIPQESLEQLKTFTDTCLVEMPFSFDDLISAKKDLILSSFGIQRLTTTDRLYFVKDVSYLPFFVAGKQRVSEESVRFGFLWLHDDRKNLQSILLQILTKRM